MKLESQVVSLELAKRLKELGLERDSHFRWSEHTTPETLWCINALQELDSPAHYPTYAAFTVAELGEMLPDLYYSERWAGTKEWVVNVEIGIRENGRDYPNMKADTEAEARGLMLEYLIENKLVQV